MTNGTTDRIHALDTVRGAALILGIFFHVGLAYYPGAQVWLITDPQRSMPIAWIGFVSHIFRMTVFFLLAGFFGHLVLSKRGPWSFIKSRAKRIGLPLAIFWPLMMVGMTTLLVWGLTKQYGISPDDLPPPPPMTWQTLPLTHLWFLYVLILFYVGILVLRLPMALLDRNETLRNAGASVFGMLFKTPLMVMILAGCTAFGLLSHENWAEWFGIPTPDYGLVPHTAALISYGLAFVVGWVIFRQKECLGTMAKWWPLFLVAAIGTTGACLYMLEGTPNIAPKLTGTDKTIYAACYGLAAWTWTFGLIGLAMRTLNKPSRVSRYIADSSYWLYLIHLPIVAAMQIWMWDWTWSAPAKYAFILSVSIPVMLLSYQLLVRHSFIGSMLNGPRKRAAAKKDAVA